MRYINAYRVHKVRLASMVKFRLSTYDFIILVTAIYDYGSWRMILAWLLQYQDTTSGSMYTFWTKGRTFSRNLTA